MTEFKGERYPGENLLARTMGIMGRLSGHLERLIVSGEDGHEVLNEADIIRHDLDRLQSRVGSACVELRPKLALLKQRALNRARAEYVAKLDRPDVRLP